LTAEAKLGLPKLAKLLCEQERTDRAKSGHARTFHSQVRYEPISGRALQERLRGFLERGITPLSANVPPRLRDNLRAAAIAQSRSSRNFCRL
jgi:hypothetical protein